MLIFLLAEVSYWWQMTAVQRKFTSAFFWAILLCIIVCMMENTSVRRRKVALENMILTFTVWYAEQKTIVKLMRENRTIFFL